MNGYVTLRDKGTWNYCIELRPGRGLLVGVSHRQLAASTYHFGCSAMGCFTTVPIFGEAWRAFAWFKEAKWQF